MKFIQVCSDIYNTEDIQVITVYVDNITNIFKIEVKLRGITDGYSYSFDDRKERDRIFAKIKSDLVLN